MGKACALKSYTYQVLWKLKSNKSSSFVVLGKIGPSGKWYYVIPIFEGRFFIFHEKELSFSFIKMHFFGPKIVPARVYNQC